MGGGEWGPVEESSEVEADDVAGSVFISRDLWLDMCHKMEFGKIQNPEYCS